jgi:hypothetical protein
LVGIALWRIVIWYGEVALYITFGVFPLAMIATLYLILYKLSSIYSGLVPYCTEPDELKFPKYNDLQIEPLFNIGKIPQPPYLTGKVIPKDRDNGMIRVCCKYYHPYELSYAFFFNGRYPNRHEVLFWFDSAGPKFIVNILQSVVVLLTLWAVVIILYYIGFFRETIDWFTILTVSAAFLICLFILYYLIPECLRYLSIVSKIGMMKDTRIMEEVVLLEKQRRAENCRRIYR